MIRSTFPPRFKQTFAFQPFRLFCHPFWDNSNSVSLHFGLLIYKWSLVYPTLVRRLLHWQTPVETSERGHAYIKWFGVACSTIHITNHCYQWLPEYQLYYVHEIIWWPCGNVICHPQKYARDQWVMGRAALWLYAIIRHSLLWILLTLNSRL